MTPSNSGRTDPPAGRSSRRGQAAGTGRATSGRSAARRTGRDGRTSTREAAPAAAGHGAGEATEHPAGGTATAAWLEPRRLVPDLVIAHWLLLIALLDADGPFRAALETLRRLLESR